MPAIPYPAKSWGTGSPCETLNCWLHSGNPPVQTAGLPASLTCRHCTMLPLLLLKDSCVLSAGWFTA